MQNDELVAGLRAHVQAAQTALEQVMIEREALVQSVIALEARLAAVTPTAQMRQDIYELGDRAAEDGRDYMEAWSRVYAWLISLPPVVEEVRGE